MFRWQAHSKAAVENSVSVSQKHWLGHAAQPGFSQCKKHRALQSEAYGAELSSSGGQMLNQEEKLLNTYLNS